MKTDAWMPLYIGDYLADTMHLSTDEHGAYLLLLMHSWRNGPLPDDNAQLARIARMTPDAWSIAQASVRAFFTQRDGMLVQPRLEREREITAEKAAKNRDKAAAAAGARWGKPRSGGKSNAPSNAPSIPQALPEQCPSQSHINPPTPHGGEAVGAGLKRGVQLAPSLRQAVTVSAVEPTYPWRSEIGAYRPQGVYERVLGAMQVGNLRFPDLPGVIEQLLEEGCSADLLHQTALALKREGMVPKMNGAGMFRAWARKRRETAGKVTA